MNFYGNFPGFYSRKGRFFSSQSISFVEKYNMFTPGQWIFAGIFLVAFVAIIAVSYRKDLKLHRKYYKGSLYILGGFLLFIVLLFLIKSYLNP